MSILESAKTSAPGTHVVTNQPPPLENYNAFTENRPLAEGLAREHADWAIEQARALGSLTGGGEAIEWARQAHRNPPLLHTHDRFGHRIDQVEYHPAWHEILRLAVEHGCHSLAWREQRPGAHVARAVLAMLMWQLEPGHGCPMSMTYSAVPALRTTPELAAEWEPRLTSTTYDPRPLPADQKTGALCGMAMTEKQGGSDVRGNTTAARPLGAGGPGGEYRLTGHKWFCSAPMSDAFLVLAQTESGLSCFLLPRILPDGTRNAFALQRLKDKLGNRSNASAEVEFDGAWAQLVGPEGRGVPTIIQMVSHTRLDNVLGTTAGMRQAVEEATWHAAHRYAFGHRLIEAPLMQNVLADLCLETEAATVTALRLARAHDADADADEHEQAFKRVATAVGKYWVCKRGPAHAAEALECLGGNGYIEESAMPRRYREQPLMSIWEGSGNVICLDVLRAMTRSPETSDAFVDEVDLAAGTDRRFDHHVTQLKNQLANYTEGEQGARRLVENMALALQGSLLLRHAPPAVADAFCVARLDNQTGLEYGTLPPGLQLASIIERHTVSA